MKRFISLAVVAALLSLGLNAQTRLGGNIVTEFDLEGFHVTTVYSPEFSYKHDGSRKVVEKIEDGKLTMKMSDGNERDGTLVGLVIYTNDIKYLKLSKSSWMHNDEGASKLINNSLIELDKRSRVNLVNLRADELVLNLNTGAELNIAGNANKVHADVDGASYLNTYNFRGNTMDLVVKSASKVNIDAYFDSLKLEARYAVEITMSGSLKKLDLYANMAVKVLGEKMKIDVATIEINRGCQVTVNAAKMNDNPEIKNVHPNFKGDKTMKFSF